MRKATLSSSADAVSRRTAALLDRAGEICDRYGVQLTELRRQVLGLILEAEAPIGAYDILDGLRQQRPGAAPPTVYRALDFLLANGLIHRVERLAAFVGCVAHDPGTHAAQFLICRSCGRVTELDDHELAATLAAAAARLGFAVSGATIEAEGLCHDCTGAAREPERMPSPTPVA